MVTVKDVLDAMAHVQRCTGNPIGWQAGLSPTEVSIILGPLNGFGATTQQLDAILAKIRHHHPTLFDATTGMPVDPPGPASPDRPAAPDEPQSGAAAEAMKGAEAALALLNSDAAEFDRHMLDAILQAHKTTEDGKRKLTDLGADIENAVATRTLDTPLAAREFQRYLIGRLNDILAVVADANDSDQSKKALLAALAALYAAQGADGGSVPAGPDDRPAPAPETVIDPDLEAFPGGDPAAVGAAVPVGAPEPAGAPFPAGALPPNLPNIGGVPGGAPLAGPIGFPLSGLPTGLEQLRPLRDDGDAALTPDEEIDDDAAPPDDTDDTLADAASPAAGPTTVTLPNGETVTAASPQLAAAIKAAAEGTPVAEAFHQQGVSIPPPGTPVANPIDPARVAPGDIGMFTDRHALAIGRGQALLDGQIQRIANVSGPSFLGWQHPPATTASATTDPAVTEAPAPTRPSATVAR